MLSCLEGKKKKRSEERQKKKLKWGTTAWIKKADRVKWMRKQEGSIAGNAALLSSLCLLPSFPSSRFLSLPIPVDHMTGATYITAISKNTSAERFMRSEQGATRSSSDVADWEKRAAYVLAHRLPIYLPLDDCAQEIKKKTKKKPIHKINSWGGCKRTMSACEHVLRACGVNHSYSSQGSQSCTKAEHTDPHLLVL